MTSTACNFKHASLCAVQHRRVIRACNMVGKHHAKHPMSSLADDDTLPGNSAHTEPQWRTQMFAGPVYRSGVSFSADVRSYDVLLCRLVYAGPKRTNSQAHASLADRALNWIASYETRPSKPV